MASLPDDLLRCIDEQAQQQGTTRSGYLRQLAEESLRQRSEDRAARMRAIDASGGALTGHGGGVAELAKGLRPGS